VGSVDGGDEAMKRYDSQGFEALASTRAESTDQRVLTDGGAPETVDCATCGATARRITWGATACTCYRCTECHAGGHIAPDSTRQGGVFQELNNLPTRLLNGDTRVLADGGRAIDDIPRDLPELDLTVKKVAEREGDGVTTSWRAIHHESQLRAKGDTPAEAVDVLIESLADESDGDATDERLMSDGGLVADSDPECPSCDAVDWDQAGTLSCDACGYTPRTAVREQIRAALGGDD
jgi:hypothetical protein